MKQETTGESSERILIVEDESDLLFVLAERLRWEGYSIDSASTKNQALLLLDRALPDLVLLDLMLPDGSGLEILDTLRARPDARSLPIVILSGLGDEKSIEEGLKRGADAYLSKPTPIVRVIETIRRHLAAR